MLIIAEFRQVNFIALMSAFWRLEDYILSLNMTTSKRLLLQFKPHQEKRALENVERQLV